MDLTNPKVLSFFDLTLIKKSTTDILFYYFTRSLKYKNHLQPTQCIRQITNLR